MKKKIIVSGSILLIATALVFSCFWFVNTYEKPVKGDIIKITDEIVDFKTLSDGKHTIAVGDRYPGNKSTNDVVGLIKLYDEKCNLVRYQTFDLKDYKVYFQKAYINNKGISVLAYADNGKPTGSKCIRLYYDNDLNLIKYSDIKIKVDNYYFFDDVNIYTQYYNNEYSILFYNQDDKKIKTLHSDKSFHIFNISCCNDLIVIQGSRDNGGLHTSGYAIVFNKKGDFLWNYQYKELNYAAIFDAYPLPDHTMVLYGEADGMMEDNILSPYNGLSDSRFRSNTRRNSFIIRLDQSGKQMKAFSQRMTLDHAINGIRVLSNGKILALGLIEPQEQQPGNPLYLDKKDYAGFISILDQNLKISKMFQYPVRSSAVFVSPDNQGGFYTYIYKNAISDTNLPSRVNHFKTAEEFALSRNMVALIDHPVEYIYKYINYIFVGAVIVCAIMILLYLLHTKPKYKRLLINLIKYRKICLNDYSHVKAVVFDVGKTLNYPVTGNWFITPRMFDYIDKKEFEQIHKLKLQLAFKKAGRYLDRNHALHTEEEEYSQFIRFYSILAEKLPKLCCDEQAKLQEAIEKIAWEKVYSDEIYGLYDDVKKYLPVFKEHFKLGVLSDTWPSLKRFFINNDLLSYFDSFVMSCDVGACKPDPKMYQTSIKELSMKPEQIVFVDDSVKNLAGAERLGMLPVQIRREGQKQGEYPCVDNLKELAELLKIEILEKEVQNEQV